MVENQYQKWFFDNSGNGFKKRDIENPYKCILNQHYIAFSSEAQNFGHIRNWVNFDGILNNLDSLL